MTNEPEQFDREALLILYAGGEMTAAQRAEFDARLASDPQLAVELQRLREATDRIDASLRELDDLQRPPTNPAVAVRRVERAMQQWAVDRLRRPAEQPPALKRMPWWSYPLTGAAIVMIAFIVWSDRQPILPTAPADNYRSTLMLNEAEALAERLENEFTIPEAAADGETQVAADGLDSFFINPAEVATW